MKVHVMTTYSFPEEQQLNEWIKNAVDKHVFHTREQFDNFCEGKQIRYDSYDPNSKARASTRYQLQKNDCEHKGVPYVRTAQSPIILAQLHAPKPEQEIAFKCMRCGAELVPRWEELP